MALERPLPVEVVRPGMTGRRFVEDLVFGVVYVPIRAWIVMLLLPVVWKPVGYWWCLAAVLVLDNLLSTSGYRAWTRDRR